MAEPTLEQSRERLLAPLEGARDVTVLALEGNMGDALIAAGTERLLRDVPHLSIRLEDLWRIRGDVLVLVGGGAWGRYFGLAPSVVALAERNFRRVVVYPSTFDLSARSVYQAVAHTEAKLFAREWVSYDAIKPLQPPAELAHDAAFFVDLRRWKRAGSGTLLAYRTDREAIGRPPEGNRDISLECSSLHEWLGAIAEAEEVHTDRAHVLIAAALLGRKVFWSPNAYFKVEALAQTWFRDAENVVRESA